MEDTHQRIDPNPSAANDSRKFNQAVKKSSQFSRISSQEETKSIGSLSYNLENHNIQNSMANAQNDSNLDEDTVIIEVVVESTDIAKAAVNKIVNLSVEEMYKVVFRNRLSIHSFSTKSHKEEDSENNHHEIFMDLAMKVFAD